MPTTTNLASSSTPCVEPRPRGGRPRLPDKIHVDLPTKVGPDFARAFDVRLVEKTTSTWESWFGLLMKFTDREGHARVPKSHVEDGVTLGSWVSDQRSRRDVLTDKQQERLEALPGWNWDARTDQWDRRLNLLRRFEEREGHALVPQGHIEDRVNLGSWVMEQRGNQEAMSDERRPLCQPGLRHPPPDS